MDLFLCFFCMQPKKKRKETYQMETGESIIPPLDNMKSFVEFKVRLVFFETETFTESSG